MNVAASAPDSRLPRIQIAHLAFSSVLPQGRRVQRYVSEMLYAGYFWMLCGAMLPIAWLLVACYRGVRGARLCCASPCAVYCVYQAHRSLSRELNTSRLLNPVSW